jgi:hypothetical protein
VGGGGYECNLKILPEIYNRTTERTSSWVSALTISHPNCSGWSSKSITLTATEVGN